MRKAYKHITTGAIISEEQYALLGIVEKSAYVPLIQKTRTNDSIVYK